MWERPANNSATRSTSCRTIPRLQQSGARLPRTGQAGRLRGSFSESNRPGADVRSLPEPGHGAGGSGKVRPRRSRRSRRSIELRPNQYRAWGILASVYASQHADAAKVRETYLKAIALADDLLKQTPKDEYLLADVGGYYAAVGMEKESVPLLAQAAALGQEIPEVLYQVAVGYELVDHRDEALGCLAKARAGGYSSEAIARNPLLDVASRGPAIPIDRRRAIADPSTGRRDAMTNPNVDRAPAPKKKAKKTKKR